jgi:hypothetical protein
MSVANYCDLTFLERSFLLERDHASIGNWFTSLERRLATHRPESRRAVICAKCGDAPKSFGCLLDLTVLVMLESS